jgi:sensor domain CHASE-containing protein
MGPVLEDRARNLSVMPKHFRNIAIKPRMQDQVVSPLHGTNAVNLHEPELPNDAQHRRSARALWGMV